MKIRNKLISLVIPCYNESDRFSLLQGGILDFDRLWPDKYEVILVDDGSQDETLKKMNVLADQHLVNGKCIVIDLPQNLNKGGALKEGVRAAHGDHILTLDADMSTPPTQLLDWLIRLDHPFAENTIYIGSRGHHASYLEALANRKKLGNIFNTFIKWVTPLNEADTQCGFKLYPKNIAKDLFAKLEDHGWAHDIEILSRAHYQQIPILAMPVTWVHVEGSKINVLLDGIKMAVQSYKIGRRLRKEYKSKSLNNRS